MPSNEPPRSGWAPFGSPAPKPIPSGPTLCESVRLECVAPDAGSTLLVRLERYPEVGRAWLWVVVCVDGAVYTYHDVLRDRGAPVDLAAETARYEIEGKRTLVLGRIGAPDAVTDAAARVDVMAHEDAHPGSGEGRTLVSIDAAFHASSQPLPDPVAARGDGIEVTGDLEGAVLVGGREVYVGGRASWHEARRHDRSWIGPTMNARLRGPDLALIETPGGPAGRVVRLRGTREVQEVSIEAVGDEAAAVRALMVGLDDGTELMGALETAYAWSLPIGNGRRHGTVVRGVLDGSPLTGMLEEGDDLFGVP